MSGNGVLILPKRLFAALLALHTAMRIMPGDTSTPG